MFTIPVDGRVDFLKLCVLSDWIHFNFVVKST